MFADYNIGIQVRSGSEFYYRIGKQVWLGSEFLWFHDFSSLFLLPMLWSIYFNTLIDTTFLCLYCYRHYNWSCLFDRHYNWSCLFERTLWLVFLTWTDVTIGVINMNRCYNQCSQFNWRYDQCYELMTLLPTLQSVLLVHGPLLTSNVGSSFKL